MDYRDVNFKDFSEESKKEMLKITKEITSDKRYFPSIERKRSAEITLGFRVYVGGKTSLEQNLSLEEAWNLPDCSNCLEYPWVCGCSIEEKEKVSRAFNQKREYIGLDELRQFDKKIIEIKQKEAKRIEGLTD